MPENGRYVDPVEHEDNYKTAKASFEALEERLAGPGDDGPLFESFVQVVGQPRVHDISPSAALEPGKTFEMIGEHLEAITSVTVGGKPASFRREKDRPWRLDVVMPAGASDGTVSWTTGTVPQRVKPSLPQERKDVK